VSSAFFSSRFSENFQAHQCTAERSKTKEEKYDFLKQLQGELQVFYLELRPKLQIRKYLLNQLISAVRSSMHSKCERYRHNISNLRNSSKDIKYIYPQQQNGSTIPPV
jgi:hypothetical protein